MTRSEFNADGPCPVGIPLHFRSPQTRLLKPLAIRRIYQRVKMTDKLRALIDCASHAAERIFTVRGELLPMYHCVDAEGIDLLVPAPPVDKKAWQPMRRHGRTARSTSPG
jgi:hypothetical protein